MNFKKKCQIQKKLHPPSPGYLLKVLIHPTFAQVEPKTISCGQTLPPLDIENVTGATGMPV